MLTFILGLHSFDKLCETYGKEGAVNLASLARTKLILATPDKNTADECSKWIGSREVRETDEAYSIGATRSRDAATITPRTEVKPLVMADDLMNLPQLHGYVKFPEGFPAVRIELAYVHYPEIAKGFMRKSNMKLAVYVPKNDAEEDVSNAGGQEHTSVHHKTDELPQPPAEHTNDNDTNGQPEPVIDPREITSADQSTTPAASEPTLNQDDSEAQSDDRSAAEYLGDYRPENISTPEGTTSTDNSIDNAGLNGNDTAGSPLPKREQQISIEERTGQAASDPADDERRHHHHKGIDQDPTPPKPSLDRGADMDMGL